MTSTSTITLPRLEKESPERYEARVLYITMGAARSIEAVREKIGKRSGRRLEIWSAEDGWVEHAARYDETVYTLAAQQQTTQYLADLEAHRKKAMEAGGALYAVAGKLLREINTALSNPRKIEGKDGKVYTLHAIEFNAASLATAARSLTTALDLEAHALGVDELMPRIGDEQE